VATWRKTFAGKTKAWGWFSWGIFFVSFFGQAKKEKSLM
jgi:hypothetical protein